MVTSVNQRLATISFKLYQKTEYPFTYGKLWNTVWRNHLSSVLWHLAPPFLIRNKSPSWPTSTQTLASTYLYHQFPDHYLHYIHYYLCVGTLEPRPPAAPSLKVFSKRTEWIWKHHASVPPWSNILIYPSSLSRQYYYDPSCSNRLH